MPRYLKLACLRHLYSLQVWHAVKQVMFDGEDGFDSATWNEYCTFAHGATGMFN
jgi:hypothetical protein